MKWLQGGTRKKVAGDLPKYPDGVKVEAEIKLLAVVRPKGSIESLQPAQKGNPRLEEAAMKEVRYWRFEPLRPSQPQIDQRCEIVFLFTLK
jgi:TonB family protein